MEFAPCITCFPAWSACKTTFSCKVQHICVDAELLVVSNCYCYQKQKKPNKEEVMFNWKLRGTTASPLQQILCVMPLYTSVPCFSVLDTRWSCQDKTASTGWGSNLSLCWQDNGNRVNCFIIPYGLQALVSPLCFCFGCKRFCQFQPLQSCILPLILHTC